MMRAGGGQDHGFGWGRTWAPGVEIDWSKAAIVDVIEAALGRVEWVKGHVANPPLRMAMAIDSLRAAGEALKS